MILNDLLLFRVARITATSLRGLLIRPQAPRHSLELRNSSSPGLSPFAPARGWRPKVRASWERLHKLKASISPGPEEPSTPGNLRSLPPSDPSTQSIMSSSGALESCVQNLTKADLHLAPVATRHAAVLVPLYEDADGVVQVLLTRRSSKLNSHAGEVALPGGKRDETDPDDAATALREAHEEIGLEPSTARVVAELPPLLSKHGLSVKAVAAVIPADFNPIPNPDEVADVFHVPLNSFLEMSEGYTFEDKVWNPSALACSYRVHFFQHGDYKVWGLTAAILIQTASIAFGRKPQFCVESESGGCLTQVHLDADGNVTPGRPPIAGIEETLVETGAPNGLSDSASAL